jgi:RNA polymerase subunit RPABC4/transcription elongation factor Spt4
MQVANEKSTRFMDEVRIISPVAYVIAALAFVGLPVLAVFVKITDKNAPPFYIVVPAFLVAAAVVFCYVLLIGYINRDAGRRGMNRLGWTLLAIFIPNALGIVLYFVLRKPRAANCPQCGTVVEPGFAFCPRCRQRLNPVCPHCQRGVNTGDKFCPYCGGDLATTAAVSAPTSR